MKIEREIGMNFGPGQLLLPGSIKTMAIERAGAILPGTGRETFPQGW